MPFLTVFGCSRPDAVPIVRVSDSPYPLSHWEQIQEITDEYCARCHEAATFLQSEDDFLTSAVKNRILRREMPPPSSVESRSMEEATRHQLLDLFGD